MPAPNDASTSGAANRSPQEKFVLILEAVKRSLLSAEILLRNVYAELDGIAQDVDAKRPIDDRAAAPLISCLGFIDFAFRFKSLMDALPLVSAKHPQMIRLMSALASVESARHHLQHLRGELSTNDAIEYPILGSISWVTNNAVYSMCLGTPIGTARFASISYDRENRQWTAAHLYAVRDAVVDTDMVIEEMRKAFNWLASAIFPPEPSLQELKWGATIVLKMAMQHPE